MNTRLSLCIALIALSTTCAMAQSPTTGRNTEEAGLEMSVNPMDTAVSNLISKVAERYYLAASNDVSRAGFGVDLWKEFKYGAGGSIIGVLINEGFNIANYRKKQRNEYEQMVSKECTYTDTVAHVRGNTDFYSRNSLYGPLDPSNINFDGITFHSELGGTDFLYISCHLDTTRLTHLFEHSKFYLVVDSIYFDPKLCHLPNLSANGIHMDDEARRKVKVDRNDSFSFDEREKLKIDMEMTLTSSWINEAVMVMKDVELGRFTLSVDIPTCDYYTYSRRQTLANIAHHRATRGQPDAPHMTKADTTLVVVNGDCFVVPRSYMPLNQTTRMWGTGEYKLAVRLTESCDMKKTRQPADGGEPEEYDWNDDYNKLRDLQKRSSGFKEIFHIIYQQNGSTVLKTIVKQVVNVSAEAADLMESSLM